MTSTTTNDAGITTRDGVRGKTYRVNYRNAAGAQRGYTCKTLATARRYRAWRQLNPTAPDSAFDSPAVVRRTTVPTLAEFWRDWNGSRRVGADRRTADDSLFRTQLAPLHGARLTELLPMHVDNWSNDLTGAQRVTKAGEIVPAYAPRTILDAFALLGTIYRAAVRNRVIKAEDNPMDAASRPEVELKALTAADVYTPTELASLLKASPDRYRALFGVLGYTGARLSEALALTADLVDLDGTCAMFHDCPPRAHIHLGHFRIKETAGKPERKPGGKTRNALRTVPLTAETVRLLRDHMAEYPATADTIFPTESGAIPNRSNLRQRQWSKTCTAAGIKYLPIRNLRHTAASHMLAAGLRPVTVAARLGHYSPTVTMNIYARLLPTAGEDTETALLERFLGE